MTLIDSYIQSGDDSILRGSILGELLNPGAVKGKLCLRKIHIKGKRVQYFGCHYILFDVVSTMEVNRSLRLVVCSIFYWNMDIDGVITRLLLDLSRGLMLVLFRMVSLLLLDNVK